MRLCSYTMVLTVKVVSNVVLHSSREHRTNLGKRKNGRCEEDVTRVSGKRWGQRARSSICYSHGELCPALGHKPEKQHAAFGNFTLAIEQLLSIPSLCNSVGKGCSSG